MTRRLRERMPRSATNGPPPLGPAPAPARGLLATIPAIATIAATALILALAGCTATAPKPTATAKSSHSSNPTPTTTPAPTLDLNGDARANLAYFNKVGHALLDGNTAANSDGRAIVDAFVAAGFPKKAMEVTPDRTSIGLAAWNIEFSVKLHSTCLIGQAGDTGFQSFVAPVVSTGTCLIGVTRTIDW